MCKHAHYKTVKKRTIDFNFHGPDVQTCPLQNCKKRTIDFHFHAFDVKTPDFSGGACSVKGIC